MIGIIATIIAAKKGHTTFAWIVGIWTGIAIILILSGASYAFAPGVLFLFIAIGMKKIPAEGSSPAAGTVQTPTSAPVGTPAINAPLQSSTEITRAPVSASDVDIVFFDDSSKTAEIRFCRYCGQKLEPGSRFCQYCGARL